MVFAECAPRGRGAGKCGVRGNLFSAPRGRGARPIQFVYLSRRCPAFAGLRLAIFVVNAATVRSMMGWAIRPMARQKSCQELAEKRE